MVEAYELSGRAVKAPERQNKGVGDILGDAVHSALYTAMQEPISGVTQIVDEFAGTKYLPKVQFIGSPVQAKFGTADWHAQQVGSAVGMLLPFMLVGKGVRGVIGTSAEEASLMSRKAAFGMSVKEAGLTGFAYDAFLRPSDTTKSNAGIGQFLLDRGTQGAVGAGTFMTLTGASVGLSRFAGSAAIERSALLPLLKNPIASGVLSGIPAGLFSAEASSLTKTGHLASRTELGQAVYGMSVVGGGFGVVHSLKAAGSDGVPGEGADADRSLGNLSAPAEIQLRTATDEAELRQLEKMSEKLPGLYANLLAFHANEPDGKIRVAVQDEHSVGFVAYSRGARTVNEVSVAYLGVDPAFQRLGIAKKLMQSVINEDHGDANLVVLSVRESNEKAITLYRKLGFEEAKRLKNHYGGPAEDGIGMYKELKPGGWQKYLQAKAEREGIQTPETLDPSN